MRTKTVTFFLYETCYEWNSIFEEQMNLTLIG